MFPLCQGRIILAEVTDLDGKKKKARPLVIVTASDEIATSDPIVGVCLTTGFVLPLSEFEVEIPRGTVPTGLTKPCVAVCNWIRPVYKADILETRGVIRGRPLLEILEKMPRDFLNT